MNNSPNNRNTRVAAQIQKLIAGFIENLRDPRLPMTTVYSVDVNRDLSTAKVFVRFLSTETEEGKESEWLKCLQQASGFLRTELAHQMTLRKVPELEFIVDDHLDKAEELAVVFKKIKDEGHE